MGRFGREALILIGAMTLAGIPCAGMMSASNPGIPGSNVFGKSYDNNNYSSLCVACHQRDPGWIGDNTLWGSHFIYGGDAFLTRNAGTLEKLSAWDNTGALSKYGVVGDNVSATGTAGELICESCHNIVTNAGAGKLVVNDNEAAPSNVLCEGCHGRTAGVHHLMTGDVNPLYNRPMSNSDSLFVLRNPVAGSEATYPGSNELNCRSCHKPHKAQTKTGARILKRGYRASSAAPGGPVDGAGVTGLERQFDVAPAETPRLVTDFTPLCDACHKVSY